MAGSLDEGSYFHVRLTSKDSSRDEVKVDLSVDQLKEQVLHPYRAGEHLILNGKTFQPEDIERLRISKSQESSDQLIRRIKAENRRSRVAVLGGPSYEWKAASRAEDITDQLVKGPPGYGADNNEGSDSTSGDSAEDGGDDGGDKVFVVHGHEHSLKNELSSFLNEVGLDSVVLHREPDAGMTVIEKFEEHTDVSFAVVLVTPDDLGMPIEGYEKLPEGVFDDPEELAGRFEFRARQNVLFEWGYLIGKLGRNRVCCVYVEGVELPSDLSGLLYKEVGDNIQEVGYDLIKEFKQAGLDIEI